MAEETRVVDQTRRLLKVFGVKLTDYEEKTAALLDLAAETSEEELRRRVAEAMALTEDLNKHVGHITSHAAELQNRVLARAREALERAPSRQ